MWIMKFKKKNVKVFLLIVKYFNIFQFVNLRKLNVKMKVVNKF